MTVTRIPNVTLPDPFLPNGWVEHGDLLIANDRIVGMAPSEHPPRHIVLPLLAEPHVHLDKCHTLPRLGNVGGDLAAAIAAQFDDKQNWTPDDIRTRAERGMSELIAAGCGTVRTHVDWSREEDLFTPPPAWRVLCEMAEDSAIPLQLSPLIGIDSLADPDRAMTLGAVFRNTGVLGAFVYDQPGRIEGIKNAFAVAQRYDLALDFHVDEGLDPGLNGLEMIAQVALETGFDGPVLCGHACSLANLAGDALRRQTDLIATSGINIAALPSTNLYLQGRTNGTPDRRGLTRLRELTAAGVNTCLGTDNVRDAFCPVGRHAPLHTLELAILTGHLDPPLGRHLPLITNNAARAMGLPTPAITDQPLQNLLLYDAADMSELFTAPPPRPLSLLATGATT